MLHKALGPCLIALLSAIPSIPATANAACNAIPAVEQVMEKTDITATAGAKALLAAREAAMASKYPYKAALGRINRALIVPGKKQYVAVAPDGVCVSAKRGGPAQSRPRVDDLVAILFFQGRDEKEVRTYARVYASPAVCRAVQPTEVEQREHRLVVLPNCSNRGVEMLPGNETVPYGLALPLPDRKELTTGVLEGVMLSPAVRLVVATAPTGPHKGPSLTAQMARQRCDAACSSESGDSLQVCVDSLYNAVVTSDKVASLDTSAVGIPNLGTVTFEIDPVLCELSIPVGASCDDATTTNTFVKKCVDGDGSDDNLKKCEKEDSSLLFWQSSCGGVHIPFSWDKIRNKNNKKIRRVVAGVTGEARAGDGSLDKVYLPGSEFTGSTACVEKCDDAHCTNAGDWRLPDLHVSQQAPTAPVLELRGSVDQPSSVVHVFPRMKVGYVCGSPAGPNEACLGVRQEVGINEYFCACTDRYGQDCGCALTGEARFFACNNQSGPFEDMPCTRHQHCGAGKCDTKPKCRDTGTVWGTASTGNPSSSCKDDSDCSGGQICGYQLFDASDRVDAVSRFGSLNEWIGPVPGPTRRGFCENDPSKKCDTGHPNNCDPLNPNLCRSYRLEAQGERP